MAIDFWKAQQKAKTRTLFYLIAFLVMTLLIAIGFEWILQTLLYGNYGNHFPYFGLGFALITVFYAAFNYLMYERNGGAYVAESLGAKRVSPNSEAAKDVQLLHIVQEMAIAANLPIPDVYILNAQDINAFAAGLTPDKAAITVTQGALETLSRDELQGVIAHEFGHIYNKDMKIGLQLAAMVAGFFVAITLGLRLLQFSSWGSDEDRRMSPALLIALGLFIAGGIAWFGGSILRSLVSREREYLADATGVQFTRNPDGLIDALKKIQKKEKQKSDMPQMGQPYAHLYFSHPSLMGRLFATHPPIELRIAALEGRDYIDLEKETVED